MKNYKYENLNMKVASFISKSQHTKNEKTKLSQEMQKKHREKFNIIYDGNSQQTRNKRELF